jgi:hypothetical protein
MTRELRKTIISLTVVVTMAVSFLIAIPIASKWGQARVQEIAKTEKGKGLGQKLMYQGVVPQVLTVFGCMGLALVVGAVVAKKLPPADPIAKRSRRR